ncbi:MAG: HlyD family efflux transporter periplasmic adaptor subunit, partial [Candidatus Pacebacteria bacterium]|nr:HlyD family efflux transporter periplasmic adaptor subunit [Candidatus Paceibacterota bacterium]
MKIIQKIKKHIFIYSAAMILIVIVIISFGSEQDSADMYETMVIEKTDVVQEVEVTGKVRPSEDRDLSFQRGGTVARVYASVGDEISAGEWIASLDTSELQAQLTQAKASIIQEESIFAELKRGSRSEELALAQTAVGNAERTLENANISLENVIEKAQTDIVSVYNSALTSAQSAVSGGKNALVAISDVQYTRFTLPGVSAQDFAAEKEKAIKDLFNVSGTAGWVAESVSELSGGVYSEVQGSSVESDLAVQADLDSTLSDVQIALGSVYDVLEAIPILSTFSTTEKADIVAQKTAVSAAITSLSANLQAVEVQKAVNTSAIMAAETGIITSENTLRQVQSELILKEAGSTQEALTTQNARIVAAYAQQDLIQAQIYTMILRAPIDGVVTKQDARNGVFVQAGSIVASVISKNSYEVEIFIPEVDISKVSIGDVVEITLDAYTNEDIFVATVASIDPAETVIEGVSTYRVTVVFSDGEDERIKSGMTADSSI